MKYPRILTAVVLCAMMFASEKSMAQSSRLEMPNDVNIELLGRCILYSFNYQRMLSQNFGLEGGFSLIGGSGASITLFSAGARAYLLGGNSSPCLGAGFVFASASTDAGPFSGSSSGSYGYIAPGFEYRSSGGFLFRASINFLVSDGFFVWPGFQFGIAF
jgi:hypothetical protein